MEPPEAPSGVRPPCGTRWVRSTYQGRRGLRSYGSPPSSHKKHNDGPLVGILADRAVWPIGEWALRGDTKYMTRTEVLTARQAAQATIVEATAALKTCSNYDYDGFCNKIRNAHKDLNLLAYTGF